MPFSSNILIVDDEPRLCQSLSSILTENGFSVHLAYSGDEALAGLTQSIDMVLVDLFLPDISGIALMGKILEIQPDLPVIIMTGNASIDSAIDALQKGAYDYLRKPFEAVKLLKTINNALKQTTLAKENQQINQQLAVSQRDYRYLVENSPDIIYMLDQEGRFSFVNPSIKKMTGLTPDKVIGRHYSTIIDKHHVEPYRWFFNERRTGERARKWNPLQLSTFDSSGFRRKGIRYAELRSTGMYQAKGQSNRSYVGTHGVIRDITEKKIAYLKKKKIKAQLQKAEKLEMVGTLASGVAHDLNNLLTSILMYPELLLMEMDTTDPNREYIQKIKKSGEDAAVIVNDMLTLARRRVPADQIFNMDEIISDCLTSPEFMKIKSRYPAIDFNINLNCGLLNMKGSPVHIAKALINLLNNAAEAMPQGGMITLLTQTCRVDTPFKNHLNLSPGAYIKLVVADSGIGISKKDIKKIFDPFYTRKKMGRSGTGLGMTIVWSTIKDHKGHIDIQSAEGRGTTITLYFPVTRKKRIPPDKVDISTLKGKGQTILIVDDLSEQRKIASTMMMSLGYKPHCVNSGEACIDYLKTMPVDLVLLDMVLGSGMDGLDTYRQIKKVFPDQRVIIVSGQSRTKRIEKALNLGVCRYVKKPYSIENLGEAVKQELSLTQSDPCFKSLGFKGQAG